MSFPTISERLSRWTLPISAVAFINYLVAQILIVFGYAGSVTNYSTVGNLITIHLITIGWLTLLIFGALFQFVPVITTVKLKAQWPSLVMLITAETGLLLMISGFVGMSTIHPAMVRLLPVGGVIVLIAITTAAVSVALMLLKSRPFPLPSKFLLVGLFFLFVTIFLGIVFASIFGFPGKAGGFAVMIGNGLQYHLIGGGFGWFTLTAMGVSYKLLPMFMLAPEERGLLGEAVFITGTSGIALWLSAGILSIWVNNALIDVTKILGLALFVISVVLYLVDVVNIYRGRKRSQIELHNKVSTGAFISLALSLSILILGLAIPGFKNWIQAAVILLLFGWLGGLSVAQLYKIVPFLTWISRYGSQLGKGKVPRVQDLVYEKNGLPWFLIYFSGAGIATIGAFFGNFPIVLRLGVAVVLIGCLGLGLEYIRAWRAYYVKAGITNNAVGQDIFKTRGNLR